MSDLLRLNPPTVSGIVTVAAIVMATASVARADCIDDASVYHGVNPALLHAIAQHESGMRAGAVNRNANGTEDLGLMQINSSWLSTLKKYGVTRQSLFNACV